MSVNDDLFWLNAQALGILAECEAEIATSSVHILNEGQAREMAATLNRIWREWRREQ